MGGLAQAVESPSSPKHSLIPHSVENRWVGDRARNSSQKRRPERYRQSGAGSVVDPALDGPREIVEFGKDRAEGPANSGAATVRAAGPPSLHEQGAGERDRRILEGAVTAKEALDDRLAGQSFRPKALERAGIAQCLAGVGTFARVRQGAPQAGQVTRQAFRQCFGTAPEAPSRAYRSPQGRHIYGALLRQVNSEDPACE